MQTAYENNFSSNMLLSAKEYIPYEICDFGFHRTESPFRDYGIATPDTDDPALPSKYPWCSSPSDKPDSVHTEQFIFTAGKALFPSLEHNHEMFVREHQVNEANRAPISYFSSQGPTVPISNRQLDFNIDIDISSDLYSSNECSSVGISDKKAWRFQYDNDLLETHSYNVTLLNSLGEENFCQAQSGTSYPVIFDSATDCNLFRYKSIPKSTQSHTSVNNHMGNNHTDTTSESSHYMDASENQACDQEHRAYTSHNVDKDIRTSSEIVINPSKSTLGTIPELAPFSHRKHCEDSNAYIRHIEPRTKNAKDDHIESKMGLKEDHFDLDMDIKDYFDPDMDLKDNFDPDMDLKDDFDPDMDLEDDHSDPDMDVKDDHFDPDMYIKDDLEDLPCMDSTTTPKSVQAEKNDEAESQLSTSSAQEISQSPPSPRINQKVHAQKDGTDIASDPITTNGSPSSSTSRVSLKWRPVHFKSMNEIKKMCEARDKTPDKTPVKTPAKRSHPTETLPPQKYDLDKFWKRSSKDKCFICLYENCMQRFDRRYNVRTHIKTHMGDRQFRCKICSKRYVRRHDLNRHTKSHTSSFKSKPMSKYNFISFRLNVPND